MHDLQVRQSITGPRHRTVSARAAPGPRPRPGMPIGKARRSTPTSEARAPRRRPSQARRAEGRNKPHGLRAVPGRSRSGRGASALVVDCSGFLLLVVAFVVAYAATEIPDANELATPRRRSSTTPTARPSWPGSPTSGPRVGAADEGARRPGGTPCSPPRTATSTRTAASPRPASPGRSGRLCGAGRPRAGRRSPSSTSRTTSSRTTTRCTRKAQGDRHLASRSTSSSRQGPDPRELPQHDLLRPRRLRHPDRLEGVLQQGRRQADLRRGAFLASVIRAPSYCDPALGRRAAGQRQGALGLRPRRRWSDQGLADARPSAPTSGLPPETLAEVHREADAGPNGYLTETGPERARRQVQATRRPTSTRAAPGRHDDRQAGPARRPGEGGQDRSCPRRPPAGLHVGLAAIKPGDGAIVALYGGADYRRPAVNAATDDKLQAGSTFKVFTLSRPCQAGRSAPRREYSGASPQYFEEFEDSGRRRRPASARTGHQLRQRELRQDRPAHGDRQLGQHRLRQAQHRRRTEEHQGGGGGRRACRRRASAPTTPTCSAPTRHRARHGQRLRDDRLQRCAA